MEQPLAASKSTEWNITGFLDESKEEPLRQKLDSYIKDLRGNDRKLAQKWKKCHENTTGSVHLYRPRFRNGSLIHGSSFEAGIIGAINGGTESLRKSEGVKGDVSFDEYVGSGLERKRKHLADDISSNEEDDGNSVEDYDNDLPLSPHSTANIPSVDNVEKIQQRITSSSHTEEPAPLLSKLAPSASVPPSYIDAEPMEHDEPDEQLDIDLATIERLVMQESSENWNVYGIDVTKRFREYQMTTIEKVKSSGLTWRNSYEILALASIFVLSPQCPYPNFTTDEWHEIIATNPFAIEHPIVPPSISSALLEAGRRHVLGLDGYMIADTSKLSRIAARTFNELMDIPDITPTKITEELHCVRYLYPILRPIFFQPLKKYEVTMNSSIPILISEFKPLGCTLLQRQKDFIKVHLRAINQQLCAKGGPGEVAIFTNMGDLVVSSFMDLKFSALYRAWPFHTTKLVTDKVSMPLLESVFCHFMALEQRMNVLAEDLSNRNSQFTPPIQMKFITEIPESPQIRRMLA
ncbi:hypothetical protein BC937DRAFT_87987 [Endogone sp. FLAS-F59071]|nr:hypothetical protein BC937DRAFT_87987 [Endogone sp. FLAS-F59071]|eukprot:RUS19103.1 hypothetical protein BC937DRAFT_87987 [Endogone sp. FLAS-F59071]